MSKFCTTKDDYIIVMLTGDLDHHITRELREEIDGLILEKKIFNIVFDFMRVSFMDSSGIGLLMGRYKKIHPMNGQIYVCNLSISIQRIFKLSGLYNITSHSFEIDHMVKEVTYEQNENRI